MIAPALNMGGTIGMCSPCGIGKPEFYATVTDILHRRGFKTVLADNIFSCADGYHASVADRAADFNQLIHDPNVDLIFFCGGEGGNEILPYIDYEYLKAHPKRVCSYSNGTWALSAIWKNTGLTTYYGSSPATFKDLRAYDYDRFLAHLTKDATHHVRNCEWKVQTGGTAEGVLIGGYLQYIPILIGNGCYPADQDYVLILEDHEKYSGMQGVSAMLSHIEQSPLMERVRGVIFGHYTENDCPELYLRLKRMGEAWNIPVLYTDDFGHGKNHAIFDLGRRVRLDADAQTLAYL